MTLQTDQVYDGKKALARMEAAHGNIDYPRLARAMRKWQADGFPWPLPDEQIRDIARWWDRPEDACRASLEQLRNHALAPGHGTP